MVRRGDSIKSIIEVETCYPFSIDTYFSFANLLRTCNDCGNLDGADLRGVQNLPVWQRQAHTKLPGDHQGRLPSLSFWQQQGLQQCGDALSVQRDVRESLIFSINARYARAIAT